MNLVRLGNLLFLLALIKRWITCEIGILKDEIFLNIHV